MCVSHCNTKQRVFMSGRIIDTVTLGNQRAWAPAEGAWTSLTWVGFWQEEMGEISSCKDNLFPKSLHGDGEGTLVWDRLELSKPPLVICKLLWNCKLLEDYGPHHLPLGIPAPLLAHNLSWIQWARTALRYAVACTSCVCAQSVSTWSSHSAP